MNEWINKSLKYGFYAGNTRLAMMVNIITYSGRVSWLQKIILVALCHN
jgi:hypothetical protein